MNSHVSPHESLVSDQELWSAFKAGDRHAFSNIYQRNFRKLVSYGFKISADKDVVKDCIQDLFVELWESRRNLTNVNSIQFYLLKSLRYKIIRHLADRGEESLDSVHFDIQKDNFEQAMVKAESNVLIYKNLDAAINLLPKRQREAVQLRYFHNMSNEQVAMIMGVNYQSACKFIYTALKSLRGIMHLSSFLLLLMSFLKKL
jgi:RNA polymerase sigma factor (sigma-70 family)